MLILQQQEHSQLFLHKDLDLSFPDMKIDLKPSLLCFQSQSSKPLATEKGFHGKRAFGRITTGQSQWIGYLDGLSRPLPNNNHRQIHVCKALRVLLQITTVRLSRPRNRASDRTSNLGQYDSYLNCYFPPVCTYIMETYFPLIKKIMPLIFFT